MSIRLSSAQVTKIKQILTAHSLEKTSHGRGIYTEGARFIPHFEIESLVEDIIQEVLPTCLTSTQKTQNAPLSAKD